MPNLPGSSREIRTRLVVFGTQAMLIYGVLLVPQDVLKSHLHIVYLLHYCLLWPLFFVARDRAAFLFSPSFLIVSYFCFSFTLGGFAFSRGYVMFPDQLRQFYRSNHCAFATAYFMVCNLCVVFAYFLAKRRWPGQRPCPTQGSLRSHAHQLLIGGIMLAVFSTVSVGLPFMGGSGNFAILPQIFGFLVIAIVLAKARWRYRFLVYLIVLLQLAAANYGNRRFVLVLVVSLTFIEAAYLQDLHLSFRRALVGVAILLAAVILQVTMTIARGVDRFDGSYWQTFRRMDIFITIDNSATFALKQTEGPTTFWHSYNAIGYVLEDHSLLCYGSTLAKTLFVVVPRSIWPNKPNSMVDIYTTRWNPAWRRMGCSTGINVYAEYFWNFHVLGVFCAVIIFYLLNRVFFFYLSLLRAGDVWPYIYLGVGYSSLLMYGRGHGLYSLATEVGIALIVQTAIFNPFVAVLRLECRKKESDGVLLAEAAPD
jgi:hypothetical protein